MRIIYTALFLALLALTLYFLAIQRPPSDTQVIHEWEPTFGDLPAMKERRHIRVLTSYSKTGFFIRGGGTHGFDYDLMQEFAKQLNKDAKNSYDEIKFLYIPVPIDQLLPLLKKGYGDIAMAGLAVTPERKKLVDFSAPYISDVQEILVTHKDMPEITSLRDLAERPVCMREDSSHFLHMKAFNKNRKKEGEKTVRIKKIKQDITTEDLLEMTNAGITKFMIADRHIAEAWAKVLPDIRVRTDITLHDGGEIAWAVRKGCPKLKAALDSFVARHKKGSRLGNILFNRYFQKARWITNPVSRKEQAKLKKLVALFEKYGKKYGFDWLALAAQAYQESGLDNSARSPAGAVGIMQVLPNTAKNPPVSIPNFEKLEPNIHAGVKYLHIIEKNYFKDLPDGARMNFLWAAYNAGPTRISALRKKAAERGFNPDKWFFNVEKIAAEEVGDEVVDYVTNINMYYLAYKLLYEQYLEKQKKGESLDL